MILLEPVAETVAPESVQVTESESPMIVTVYELNQQQQQTHQTTPKQTSTSTPTPTQTQTQNEGEKNHKKGGLNCVFGNFFFYVLDNCPQFQSLK